MSAPLPVALELLVSTRAGGGPQHVLALTRWLRARGWSPIVAGPDDGPMVGAFAAAGMEVVPLRTDRLRPSVLRRLARLVRERGVRVVHSHGKGAGVYGRLVGRLTGVPAVHTFHGLHYERYGPIARAAYLALERRLAAWTAVIVNVSRAQEAEGLALGLFSCAQSRVIPNGVDIAHLRAAAVPRDAARAALGLEPGGRLVGCAARLDAVKRLDLLLRATAALDDREARLLLVGAGDEEGRLRALAADLGVVGRVRFAGEIPEAWRLFRALDVYVAPSAKEGMPLAVLEAMTLGLPVLASDIPAHREVLGADALVAPTPAALAGALDLLLRDGARQRALGAANAARAEREFDERRMLTALEGVYREVLAL